MLTGEGSTRMKRRWRIACLTGSLVTLFALPTSTFADSRMWVAVEDLRRYTCPSVECGVVGRFFFRETIPVFETENGWSRVSREKSAACYDGASSFIEAGPDDCTAENGIVSGEFYEWVRSRYLVGSEPAEQLKRASELPGEG
jgi:hypothetical protein